MKNTFYISCPIDTYSGYGARSRDFVKAIIELDKYEVKILPQMWGNCPWGFIEDNPEWEFLDKFIIKDNTIPQKPDIWCQHTIPSEFQPVGQYNIGLTAGIETTIPNPKWIEGLNRMDLNLVSSEHSKNVFKEAKFTGKNPQTGQEHPLELIKPIEVLIEGADLELYKPHNVFESEDIYDDIKSIPESFAYLFVGHWMQGDIGHDRKNVGLMIKAFLENFKNKKKSPALIMKCSSSVSSYMDRREILRKIHEIKKSVPSNKLPNIYLLHGEFTNEEMSELYNHPKVKAMINLTKGEGFGRPLLEFSLTNKPIISTNWSGHVDFLNPEFVPLCGGQLEDVHPTAKNEWIIEGSKWFKVDLGNVGFFLNDVFNNYKNYKNKANRQGFFSRSNFSFEKMVEQLKDTLNRNVPKLTSQVELKLPKLNLPKKKLPELKLPNLKKVKA